MAEVSNSGQPARPPTPPKSKAMSEVLDDAIGFLDTSDQAFAQNPLHTPPPSSPIKSQERSKQKKKIRFDLEPSLIEDGSSDVEGSSQSSRRSTGIGASTQNKTSRSILKPYDPSTFAKATDSDVSLSSIPPSQFISLGAMLEAAVALLAKPDRASKLEAYLAIQNGLREYTDAISTDALKKKLPLFEGFIERDIDANSELHGGKDGKLIGQASKLAQYFLFKDSLFDALSLDFKTFLMDRVIVVLEDPRSPKEIVKNHAVALTNDRFLARALKGDRPTKLLNALIVLHEHISGEAILGVRLIIYQKLAQIAGNTMLARVNEWLPQIWAGMLSSVTETRSQAVAACAIAGTCFGHHVRASHAMKAFLERDSLGRGVNFDYVEGILTKWLQDPEKKERVPPMWGVVIMFMRSNPRCLDEWSRLGRWLKIIQVCFNSSDLALNEEAWTQWNNLIFAVNPTSQTSPTLRRYLVTPIVSILQRRHQTKISPEIRHAAWCSFCVLLYYSFRPGASSESLALFWKDFLQEATSKLAPLSTSNVNRLFSILHAVLGGSKLQLWDVDRYKETFRERVYPEELPRIDPAWIRRHLQMILDTMVPLAIRSTDEDQKSAEATYTVLFQAVRNAASKEIKTSAEQKTAVSAILNHIKSLASRPAETLNLAPRSTYKAICTCLKVAIKALGASVFVDPIICQLKTSGQFQAASTPARTPPVHTGRPEAPIASIFRILTSLSLEPDAQREFREAMKSILRTCLDAKSDSESQLLLLRSCADSLQPTAAGETTTAVIPLWESAIDSTISFTDAIGRINVHSARSTLASQYRTIVRMLLTGRRFVASPSRRWERLYKSVCAHVQITIGDGGVILAILEPLLRDEGLLTEKSEAIRSGVATIMLESSLPQPNARMLEFARKRLWTDEQHYDLSAFASRWLLTFMEFVQSCITRALPASGSQAHELAHALDVFVRTAPSETAFEAVLMLGSDVAKLVAKLVSSILQHPDSGLELTASPAFQLWIRVLDTLAMNYNETNECLGQVEDIFLAGFSLPSGRLAQQTIKTWNLTFGKSESLQYSSKLERCLTRLRRVAIVKAGSLPDTDSQPSQPDAFPSDGDSDNSLFPWLERADETDEKESRPERQQQLTPLGKYSKLNLRRLPEPPKALHARRTTPISSPRNKTPSKPRHEDSQIEFITVDSSPIDYNSIESQLLTAHQKEVQDRQKDSAALYEEIHSTPLVRKSSLKSKGSRTGQAKFGESTFDQTSLEPESSPLARSRPNIGVHLELPTIRIIDDLVDSDVGDIPSSPPDVQDEQHPQVSAEVSKALHDVVHDDQDAAEEQMPPPSPLSNKTSRLARGLAASTKSTGSDEAQATTSGSSHSDTTSQVIADTERVIPQTQAVPQPTPLADISPNASQGRKMSVSRENVSRVMDSFAHENQVEDTEPRKRAMRPRATKATNPPEPAQLENRILQMETPVVTAPTRSSARLAQAQEACGSTSRVFETHNNSESTSSEDVIITGRKRRQPASKATEKTAKKVKSEPVEDLLLLDSQSADPLDNIIVWEAPDEDTPTFEDEFMMQMSQENSPSGVEIKQPPKKAKVPTLKRSRSSRSIKPEPVLDSQTSFSSTSSDDSAASTRSKGKRRRNDIESEEPVEVSDIDSASRKRRKTVDVTVSIQRQPTPQATGAASEPDETSSQYATPMSTQSPSAWTSPTMAQRAHRLIGMMRSALGECRKLVLGSQEEPERQSLEDLGYEVSREIVDAGRRGRSRRGA